MFMFIFILCYLYISLYINYIDDYRCCKLGYDILTNNKNQPIVCMIYAISVSTILVPIIYSALHL